MTIKTIVIEGHKGDVHITRTDNGARATCSDRLLAVIDRLDDDEVTLGTKARLVAGAIYGTDKSGRAAATNSMVHDVLTQIQVVAGM